MYQTLQEHPPCLLVEVPAVTTQYTQQDGPVFCGLLPVSVMWKHNYMYVNALVCPPGEC